MLIAIAVTAASIAFGIFAAGRIEESSRRSLVRARAKDQANIDRLRREYREWNK